MRMPFEAPASSSRYRPDLHRAAGLAFFAFRANSHPFADDGHTLNITVVQLIGTLSL